MRNSRIRTQWCCGLFRMVCAVFLVSLFVGSAQAQGGVGSSRGLPSTSGGIHTIQGKVFDPSGRPVEGRLRMRLESPTSSTLFAATDSDGTFMFNNVQSGDYNLTIEGGDKYEDAIEHPQIYRDPSPSGRIIQLAIYMKPKMSLNPAFASVPKNALELYKKAMQSAQKGDNKKAAEQLNSAIAIHSNFGPAHAELGTIYLKLGDPAKAGEALTSAVKLMPDDFQARLNYGIALLNQKKFPEAEKELTAAVQKNSASVTAHMYLGIALMSQKKLDEAEKELRLSVAANSSDVAVAHKYLGGIYWGRREYARAAEELETYLKLAPKASDADRIRQSIQELKTKQ